MDASQRKWLWISIGISIFILILVLYFTVDENTIQYLKKIDPLFLLIALLMHLAAMLFWALRIKLMSKSLGYKVKLRVCLNLVFANLLIAAVTPSQAGGEPVRIHELYKAGVKIGDATAVVIMERVLDAVYFGFAGALAILLLGDLLNQVSPGISTMMIIGWIFMMACVVIFIQGVRNPEFLKRILMKISEYVHKIKKIERMDHLFGQIDKEVDNFHQSTIQFASHGKGGLIWGSIFTVLFWVFEFLIASFILMGLGEPPFFVESFIVQLIIAILMLIPLTPGGSGVAEVSAISLYGLFVDSSIVGVFVLLWRLILYYTNIIIGILASLWIVRREIILSKLRIKKTE